VFRESRSVGDGADGEGGGRGVHVELEERGDASEAGK